MLLNQLVYGNKTCLHIWQIINMKKYHETWPWLLKISFCPNNSWVSECVENPEYASIISNQYLTQGSRWHSPIEPMAQENKNWLKPTKSTTFRIHCDSIITRSLRGFQVFSQYNVCENRTPCVFPSQVWHQLISPEAVSTGHSIYNAYVIGNHV